MRQGEIWWTDLNPVQGREQSGRRPVLIISGNLLNRYLEVVIVVPLTTQIKRYKGNPILEPNLQNQLKFTSEALVFHVRSSSNFCHKRWMHPSSISLPLYKPLVAIAALSLHLMTLLYFEWVS